MANSHLRSNWVGEDGTQTISNFASIEADAIISGDTTTSANIIASSFVTIGTAKYIFSGAAALSPDIVAEATALVATPILGSLYMGVAQTWVLDSDTTATKVS